MQEFKMFTYQFDEVNPGPKMELTRRVTKDLYTAVLRHVSSAIGNRMSKLDHAYSRADINAQLVSERSVHIRWSKDLDLRTVVRVTGSNRFKKTNGYFALDLAWDGQTVKSHLNRPIHSAHKELVADFMKIVSDAFEAACREFCDINHQQLEEEALAYLRRFRYFRNGTVFDAQAFYEKIMGNGWQLLKTEER